MKNFKYELLKMRHARAVAEMYGYIAKAQGSAIDWLGAFDNARDEAMSIEAEIDRLADEEQK